MQKKILVLDDEPTICSVIKKYFSDKGFEVFVSCEGGDALAILNIEKPQTLIVDIRMPGINGIEVLRLAKENNKNIRVIIISAIKDGMILEETRLLGAVGYLTKPFKLEELEELVRGKS